MSESNTEKHIINNYKDSIDPEDAQSLEWYFSEGKSTFARSLTGPMLSKAELYSSSTYPCYKCHDTPGVNCETGDWCKDCNGTGFKSFTLGYNKEVTARPTAEVVSSKGYEPDIETLINYGIVARRLDKVAISMGKLGIAILETYHGDAGAKWGRQRQGRLFALLPFTDAGKRLLKKVREKEIKDKEEKNKETYNEEINAALTPLEKLGIQSELQVTNPEDWRRKLFDDALSEAEKLYKRAASAWMLSKQKDRSAPTGGKKVTDDKKKKDKKNVRRINKKNDPWEDILKPAKEANVSRNALLEIVGKEG